MPDYRRYRVPGAFTFFTIKRPFHIDAWVVLPDHMHCVITLPPGDDDFSNRIKAMKIRFVQTLPPTEGRHRYEWRRVNVVSGNDVPGAAVRDEEDYARHMDCVHFNPAKHGYVPVVAHWPHSTFHRWVKVGAYPRDWGSESALDVAVGSVDDNVVTCHSAEHPCGASALRGLLTNRTLQRL